MPAERRLAAIVFTDVAGFTELAQADEAGALRLLQEQARTVRPLVELHHGRQVKSMGDGLLLEFPDALDAVECAIDLQRHLHERNLREGTRPLRLRVGVHLGDVQGVGEDIVGDAVNVASRIEPLATPGGICVSQPVYQQVRTKVGCRFEALGPQALKGVAERLEVHRAVLPWETHAEREPKVSDPTRIAVLPFANISPDPRDEYFADGLTEELITVLSQLKGLRVISRTSVMQYKGTSKPVAQIGAELGAETVLEGSVRKAGDRLRITVQLIDARSDEHRWAQAYDRKFENVFAIQADVAERTAGALKVELLGTEREALHERPTANLEAYEAYLRGIRASEQFGLGADTAFDRQAVALLEEAIRLDPRFSAAYARLAIHLVQVMGENRVGAEVVPRIRELVAKALELRQESVEGLTARAMLTMQVDHDWPRAEADFRRAIAANPSYTVARMAHGHLLLTLQRFEEAAAQFTAARQADPASNSPLVMLAFNSAHRGDLASALRIAEEVLERDPRQPSVRLMTGVFYALSGRLEEAARTASQLATGTDQFSREGYAWVRLWSGHPDEARAFLADWEAGRFPERYPLRYAAEMYALLGDDRRALDLLEQDAREGDRALWHVYLYPSFDRIRGDPRFLALLEQQHLPTTLVRPPRSLPRFCGERATPPDPVGGPSRWCPPTRPPPRGYRGGGPARSGHEPSARGGAGTPGRPPPRVPPGPPEPTARLIFGVSGPAPAPRGR